MTRHTLVLLASAASAVAALLVGCPACSPAGNQVARVQGSVTANDLLSAPVPAVCGHKAGRLVHGIQPGISETHGYMQLAWLGGGVKAKAALLAFGTLNGAREVDAATLLSCSAGTAPWPQVIVFYAHGPTLLGWAYLTDFNLPGIGAPQVTNVHQIVYRNGGIYTEWSTQEAGDGPSYSSLDYSATLRLSGHTIVASDLVGITERQTVNEFLDDLRHGNQAAASLLVAAYGVSVTAASQFHSYPSALAAVPKCYGLADILSGMPRPLAALFKRNLDINRLCALPANASDTKWVALGMRRTGYRTWKILWSSIASGSLGRP